MSSPQTPQSGFKQRAGNKKRGTTPLPDSDQLASKGQDVLDEIQQQTKKAVTVEWDYKLALVVITVLAFLTRFWGITHPDQVVFDEVHFGKVRCAVGSPV